MNIGQSFFRGKQDYIYNFSIPVSEKISGNGDFNNNRNFFELQVDVTKVWKKIGKLETGIKSDLQQFDSKVNYFLKYNGNTISDSSRNNSYSYRDNINAGYLQLSKDVFWGITVKSGVRMENTNMKEIKRFPETHPLPFRDLIGSLHVYKPRYNKNCRISFERVFDIQKIIKQTFLPESESRNPYS
ncbi:MAG: outer membrane beta-barrel protein [Saprospiraceae bacterium]|nr:outer membrane beta-barrel protein [Saprospiraceae bacterium]